MNEWMNEVKLLKHSATTTSITNNNNNNENVF